MEAATAAEPTQDAQATAEPEAQHTRYRAFKKVDVKVQEVGSDGEPSRLGDEITGDLYELMPGEVKSYRHAHAEAGDGEYVLVPLRSFHPKVLKTETVTRLTVA